MTTGLVLVPFAFISVWFLLWAACLQDGYPQPSESDAFWLEAGDFFLRRRNLAHDLVMDFSGKATINSQSHSTNAI